MKLGLSLYTYGTDIHAGRMSVDEAIRHANEIGCEGLEIIEEQHFSKPVTLKEAAHVRELVESLGMEIACYSTYLNSMVNPNREPTLEEYIESAKEMIAMTAYLGSRLMRPAFFAEPVERLVKLVKACLPTLEKYNVIWGVELHAPFHPMHYKQALDAVDSPYFRLIPDFSCWQVNGAPGEFMDAGLDTFRALAPYMVHVHAKSHFFDDNGDDPYTPYKDLLNILKEANYTGYVVGEYEGWAARPEGDGMTSKQAAEKHFRLIEKYGR